jgi:glycosyltransferase involved in cell wall biosynthesis
MNILIFSHTSSLGGAERALVDFISLLIGEHHVCVMLPSQEGALADRLKSMGVKFGVLPTGCSLPNPVGTLLDFCDPKFEELIEQLKNQNYDLVITNTIVNLLGMLIGRKLNVPSITYVHEYIFGDKDLMPHGCRDRFYLDLIDSLSRHLLCASEYVKSAFLNQDKRSVLYPFAPYLGLTEFQDSEENLAQFSLVVVGTKSRRKNTHFAITVLKALRLRGKNLCLYIIGSDNSGSFKLTQQHLVRGEKNVFILPHMSDPFKIPGKKINLVCTYNEGFGLTITESLARGIPIVASEPGGPNEILPAEFVYAVDDVDQCVRAIEKIMANYEEHSLRVKEQYEPPRVL